MQGEGRHMGQGQYDVNGVFEGGGAKGVAYVGALRAAEEAGLTFRAVAGSSAGAITAMLVACGYGAAEIQGRMAEALGSFGGRTRAMLSLQRRSLLSSRRLRTWLDDRVGERVGAGAPRTFAALERATGVALYVVTTDLGDRQPLVFSPTTTPDASVADAVVASCAIPVAFPAQRVRIGDEVHRIADGGVWANYPSFVFLDDDFRRYHGLPDEEAARRTVGFVLDTDEADDPSARLTRLRSLRSEPGRPSAGDHGAATRNLGAVGALLSSPLVRVALICLPVLVVVLSVAQIRDGLTFLDRFESFQDVAAVGFYAVLSASIVVPLALLALTARMGAAVLDEGAVGMTTAMGVGPTVPYWVGHEHTGNRADRRHVVVRLPVPPSLGTLSFRAGGAHALAMARAYEHTGGCLPLWGFGPGPVGVATNVYTALPHAAAPPAVRRGVFRRLIAGVTRALLGALYLLYLPVAVWAAGWLAFRGFERAQDQRIAWWSVAGILGLLLVGTALHAFRRRRRALRATSWLARVPAPLLVLACLPLLALVAIGVAANANTRDRLTIVDRWFLEDVEATVLRVDDVRPDSTYRYNAVVRVAPRLVDEAPFAVGREARGAAATLLPDGCGDDCFVFESATPLPVTAESVLLAYAPGPGIVVGPDEELEEESTEYVLFALALLCAGMVWRSAAELVRRRGDRRARAAVAGGAGAGPVGPAGPGGHGAPAQQPAASNR